MGLFKKMKDILFDEELDYTEQIKITPEMRNESVPMKEESTHEIIRHEKPVEKVHEEKKVAPVSERETFQSEPTFPILDFDEKEFDFQNSYLKKEKPVEEPVKRNTNVMDYERRKKVEKRTNFGSYTKTEVTETVERKRFKPSPIISPVYGILDKDYSKEDILQVDDKVNIDTVRDKAFGTSKPKKEVVSKPVKDYDMTETVSTPDPEEQEQKGKTIDELLEDTSDIIVDINDTLEDEIDSILPEEEIETTTIEKTVTRQSKKEPKSKVKEEVLDVKEETLENDLFDLIDQMYDDKEDGE